MNISYKVTNPGVFFPFDGKNLDEGITVRALNDAQIKIIAKETETKEAEIIEGRWIDRIKIDDDKRSDMIYDYCIVCWKGLNDEDGTAIECTRVNKIKLMRENPNFALFVNEAIVAAGSKEALKKETELKNLSTS